MKTSKRTANTSGIKITFIPATNTQGNKFKITQTNYNKSVTISGNIDCEIIDFISLILNGIENIKSYSLIVDNTQDKYYLFSVEFTGKSFENILPTFKALK